MSEILNKYDKALHDETHARMLNTAPPVLLKHPRLKIPDRVAELLGEIDGIVADVGCGSGYFSVALANRFASIERIDAIDASKAAVDELIPRVAGHYGHEARINPTLGSFDSLPENQYDMVFAMGALHHSRNLKNTMSSIYRSLRPRGVLVAQEPTMPDTTSHADYAKKYNIVEERYGLKIRNGDRYDRFFRECEYKSATVLAGFDLLLWEDFVFNWEDYFPPEKGQNSAEKKDKPKQSTYAEDWQRDMAEATAMVQPKLMFARKSDCSVLYHDC